MKPLTLLVMLVFLTLWGADDALAAAWTPGGGQPASHHQEFVPLSLRLREKVYRHIRMIPGPVSFSVCESATSVERLRTPSAEPAEPLAPDLLYTFMSLQL